MNTKAYIIQINSYNYLNSVIVEKIYLKEIEKQKNNKKDG
jgi:hypothetical protein